MIYFISGLGADKRVFVNLRIDGPQKHIEWEQPLKNESLQDYSRRLIRQIDSTSEVILIGVSFGGVIAQEIARLIPVKKLIIISSIKNENEMDWKLRLVGRLNLHKPFPASVLKFFNKLTADYYFGIRSKEESKLLQRIISDTDPVFMVWAIDRLMHWRNSSATVFLHIHGTDDRIFPFGPVRNAVPVLKGGHLMILNRAEVISGLINDYLTH